MAGNSFGTRGIQKAFSVILTDGGSEFSARKEMEEFCDGSKSTTVFYCDSYCFWQKEPVKRIMSIYVTSVPKAAHSLT